MDDFYAGLDAGEGRGDKTLRPRFHAVKAELYPFAQRQQGAIMDAGGAIERW